MTHILFADTNQAGLHTLERALELGHRVTFVRGASRRLYSVDDRVRALFARARVVDVPVSSDPELLTAAVRPVLNTEPVDAVVCQLESATEAVAIACERLGLPFTGAAAVHAARNKARCRELIRAAGLAGARHALVHDEAAAVTAAGRIGHPVVVKPVSGMDSLFARRADTPAAVRAAARAILAGAHREPAQIRAQLCRGILVEEHLTGPLVSAELGVLDGRTHRFMLSGRSRAAADECLELGAAMPARLTAAQTEACFRYAEEVCRVLDLRMGIFHIELVHTPAGPALVEVNPRVMGGVMPSLYQRLTGVDFADHILDVHQGRTPAVPAYDGGRTLAVRKVMPVVNGRLGPRIDLGWTGGADFRVVDRHDHGLRPGAACHAGQPLARYVVEGDDWPDAMERGDRLIDRMRRCLGIPLHRAAPEPDDPKGTNAE